MCWYVWCKQPPGANRIKPEQLVRPIHPGAKLGLENFGALMQMPIMAGKG